MGKPRVTVLFDSDSEPPEVQDYSKVLKKEDRVEFDVAKALLRLEYPVSLLGFRKSVRTVLDGLEGDRPDVVFNMVEAWQDDAELDHAVVGNLDLLGIPYTGARPFALQLTRDKAVSKKILDFEGIRVPEFYVFPRGRKMRRPEDLPYPLIVKPLREDASLGIAQSSVVHDYKELRERARFIHDRLYNDAIVEELIVGREIYLAILGNDPPKALRPTEMVFEKEEDETLRIATYRAKWDKRYRKDKGIRNVVAKGIKGPILKKIQSVGLTTYRALLLTDYARIDMRLTPEGDVYVIEANPNPFLAEGEDVHIAARASGIGYDQLIEKILQCAITRGASSVPLPPPKA